VRRAAERDTVRSLASVRRELREQASTGRAKLSAKYFQTAPGQYGEGDAFLGVPVPAIRRIAKAHKTLPLDATLDLLRSPWHEERQLALIMMVEAYSRADTETQQRLFDAYLAHTQYINNWDLVDCSSPHIVGAHTPPQRTARLTALARSSNVWERRIAMLATQHYIRHDIFGPTLRIARLLKCDQHLMIQKAVGWMLREVGDRDRDAELEFLNANWREMPRTAVRYAIEKFPTSLRRTFAA
jgi:3-methyladenine DNA glycosylase AlkD